MNSNIANSVKQDKRNSKDIMPLSSNDGCIIYELMIALKNIGQDLLITIMNEYKSLPDEQILHLLRQFNVDFDPINYITEEGRPKFISIKGDIFQINNIMSIERDQSWGYIKNEMVYRVIINRNATDALFLSNKIINFDSLQQREYELTKLKKIFEMYNIKIV